MYTVLQSKLSPWNIILNFNVIYFHSSVNSDTIVMDVLMKYTVLNGVHMWSCL